MALTPFSPLYLLAVVPAYLVLKALYNLFLHPLRKVPGPLAARASSAWLTMLDFAGQRSNQIDRWHSRYGPVVRIAPDDVSFAEPRLIKEIYGQATPYMKSSFYDTFNQGPPGNMFDMTNREWHQERRRLLSHAFAASSINGAEPLLAEAIARFLRRVRQYQQTPFNVYRWHRRLALDMVGSLFLGKSFGTLDRDEAPQYLEDLDNHFMISAMRWYVPWMLPLTRWIPIPAWQHFLGCQKRLVDYGGEQVDDYVARYGRSAVGRKDLLTKVITGDPKLAPLSDEVIVSEVGSLIIGGTDTTSNTLTFTMYELSKHPEWQENVRQELKENNVQFVNGVATYTAIRDLPILDAVMMEGLRVHPAAPATLPRVVPAGGAVIAGVKLPAGTTIGMQQHTVHHDPAVYDDAWTFDPSRWTKTNGGTPAMKENYMPWSRGSRACMGSHLATMELKLIISAVLRGWQVSAAPGTDEVCMAHTDHFVPMPAGGKCELIYTPIGEKLT